MEEAKAAAYYDELTRKGEGAARYKQGLGFSSSSSSALDLRPPAAASSFLGNFVRASSPVRAAEIQKEAQLETIQNKLKKKPQVLDSGGDSRSHRRRSRSRSRDRDRGRYRDGRCSSSREGDGSFRRHYSHSRRGGGGEEEKDSSRRRRRSRSRSGSEERERSRRSKHRDDHSYRSGRRSRSPSPSSASRGSGGSGRDSHSESHKKRVPERASGRSRDRNAGADYAQLIEGYSQMTPAERVKAKMKLQLSQTAAKDMEKGMTSGWERFDFNKEAPLDDEEIEVAEDDESLVKDIGQTFRYSAIEAKREEEIKAAHDQAIFGAPAASPIIPEKESAEEVVTKDNKDETNSTLMNEKVFAMRQGSWRDRVRKLQDSSRN